MSLNLNNNTFTFIKRLLNFTLLFSFIYIVMLYFVSKADADFLSLFLNKHTNIPKNKSKYGGDSVYRFNEIYNYKNIDLLFIGSSHCYRSFDPRFFSKHGINTFNLGTTSQSPLNSYFLVDNFLENLNPRVIILELYWGTLKGNGVESCIDLSQQIRANKTLIRMAIATRNIQSINALICNFFKKKNTDPFLHSSDEYIKGGFVETKREDFIPQWNLSSYKIKINDYQIKYIEKIIDLIHNNGKKVLIIITPVSKAYYDKVVNYDYWSSFLNTISNGNGIHVIDFNSLSYLQSEDYYYNLDHLNSKGVSKFNEILYTMLLDMKLL